MNSYKYQHVNGQDRNFPHKLDRYIAVIKAGARTLMDEGGIFIYLCSVRLISFEINSDNN